MQADVVIIGAGAAGLMCAIEAGKRGREVILIDHAARIAEKIRISGGGRCNFTNINCAPDKFISQNPDFCRSALKRYTQRDFIKMVDQHNIAYHEKTLGQLFCDKSANDIISMLKNQCLDAGVRILTETSVDKISKSSVYDLSTSQGNLSCRSLVIATGGPSIPKMGSSAFGYEIAEQFGLKMVPPRAGLVPLIFDPILLQYTKELSGVSVDPVEVKSMSGKKFREAMLFTHRGLSGPAILQISSYWDPGEEIEINLLPDIGIYEFLRDKRKSEPKTVLNNLLSEYLPKRLAVLITEELALKGNIADQSDQKLKILSDRIGKWSVKPSGSEGYRTAEVTLGGVDTDEISSKTFEAINVPGLFFIGEVLDVTGHLGGYNFQWAWSSGWCAGQHV
ncbi:MAG: aminoacetone oxidase family FAD-binding enzyme [Micavibrio aeruginosavorus]|uniref:Aminoacetone oxidase family FAD-binding enzyme n=1 Tax=Micavibrio aeruginosavorus TaxID=349221 RepID=A0A2W5HHD9_9BACT|nr:MAG: aminoacetone oxidase family FAD-binding enzyme [Micavibrio aeruginosavorus]